MSQEPWWTTREASSRISHPLFTDRCLLQENAWSAVTISHLVATHRYLPCPHVSLFAYFFHDVSPLYSSARHREDWFQRLLSASSPETVTLYTECFPNWGSWLVSPTPTGPPHPHQPSLTTSTLEDHKPDSISNCIRNKYWNAPPPPKNPHKF